MSTESGPSVLEENSLSNSENSRPTGRKRKRNENLWERNVRKSRLNLGLAGKKVSGKDLEARRLRSPCNCRLKCSNKPQLNLENRENIFKRFWSKGDHDRQLDWVFKYVKISATKEPKARDDGESSRRQYSRSYFLPVRVNEVYEEIKCCKIMFLKTLGKTSINS